MAVSRAPTLNFICWWWWVVFSSLLVSSSSSSASLPMCEVPFQSQPPSFLDTLQSKCPLYFSPKSPLKVNGYFLDRHFTSKWGNVYTSVLFYASWCPFSHDARMTFEALSSMFPQIEHLTVELYSAMPSLLSKYGIHSLPTFLMVNQRSRMRFHGSKDLHSLVNFYKKITGFEPVHYVAVDQSTSSESTGKFVMQSWTGWSLNKILTLEPYLLLSTLFLCLRVLIFIFPRVLSRFKALWLSYFPHPNLEIFGEVIHILGRAFHMINVKRIWAKLRRCKTRNFHEGAKNARVWASSLASVSLGETPSSRL